MVSDRKSNRRGYKKTKLGWIPDEWKIVSLNSIADISMGQSPQSKFYNEKNLGLPLIQGNSDIQARKTKPKFWTSQITKECSPGDIILSVRAPVGTVAKSEHHACIGRGVCAIKYQKSPGFLYQLLVYMEPVWKRYAQGSTFEAVVSKDVKKFKIPFPTIKEQNKIAEILNTWDRAIEQITVLIYAKRQLKKGLMQQLLSGSMRFPEFGDQADNIRKLPKGWRRKILSNYFSEFTQRNDGKTDFILSCSKIYGIISQEERFDKRIASKNVSRYKVVIKGDLVYDPMLLWDTSIGFVEDYSIGCVSPAYNTFHFVGNEDEFDYVKYALFTQRMQYFYKAISQGTNRRRRKAPSKAFLKLKISIPDNSKEIEKIIQTLNSVSSEIEILERYLLLMKKQKKGLMQKLLKGEIRLLDVNE